MRRKQVTAILLSAIMTISACMPVNGIAAFAAENAGAESTEAAAAAVVPDEEEASVPEAEIEEAEAPDTQAGAEETAEEAAEEQEAVISPEEEAGKN